MEDKMNCRNMNDKEMEQVSGGVNYGKVYYCNNVCCSKHAMIVSPTVDNNCCVCGKPLAYEFPPETIDV